ncbi:MAG TPA: tol-pal system-associated acyl-CoA thioesterase [Stellaceae bacterium]|nr:tol-pal system-associated acyl-CoA thioesterase [Stellaceae bacterium]
MTAAPAIAADGVHRLVIRVYYEDTDAAGIVYHANYLKFAERGRTEFLRRLGFEHRKMRQATGLAFAVRHCRADYRKPARLDDELTVETRLAALGGASLEVEQAICRGGETLVRLDLRLACLSADGRAARLPAELRAALAPFSRQASGVSDSHGL